MTAKATSLVGLDGHARQTHAAILHLDSGELAVSSDSPVLFRVPVRPVRRTEPTAQRTLALSRASTGVHPVRLLLHAPVHGNFNSEPGLISAA
jgi:hypothetical protein